MKFEGVTFTGPPVDDPEILKAVPADLRRFLEQVNGLIAYEGGLHVRGACRRPEWHSLRHAWRGPNAFHEQYPGVEREDVPFAEDAVGDQWLLRGELVWRLAAETGDGVFAYEVMPVRMNPRGHAQEELAAARIAADYFPGRCSGSTGL